MDQAEDAFRALGTEALPYLAGLINQDTTPTSSDRWRVAIRSRLSLKFQDWAPYPRDRNNEISMAASILYVIEPPAGQLLPLIEPALLSTNVDQRRITLLSLRSVSSGKEQTIPWIVKGLEDPDPSVRSAAASALAGQGEHARLAITNLVMMILNETDGSMKRNARQELSTRALIGFTSDAIPMLQEQLADETNEAKRKEINDMLASINRWQQFLKDRGE